MLFAVDWGAGEDARAVVHKALAGWVRKKRAKKKRVRVTGVKYLQVGETVRGLPLLYLIWSYEEI